jgi:hypothetical protein
MIRTKERVLSAVIATCISLAFGAERSADRNPDRSSAITCDGCYAIPEQDGDWTDGAKIHVVTPGFSLTGSFVKVSNGDCDPGECKEVEPCKFKAVWAVQSSAAFVEHPPCEDRAAGFHSDAHPIKVCGCLPSYCFDEARVLRRELPGDCHLAVLGRYSLSWRLHAVCGSAAAELIEIAWLAAANDTRTARKSDSGSPSSRPSAARVRSPPPMPE